MELLVVIAVIGLLSSIIFAITRGANEQGRIAKGLQFGQHLQNSLGSYAVGIWSFDEGSDTTANDISGWENNGTLVNSPVWRCASVDTNYTPSGQGCSLEFNGSTNYVDVGNPTSLQIVNNFTVEMWAKFDPSQGSLWDPISHGHSSTQGWVWQASGASLGILFGYGGTITGPGFSKDLRDNTWHHLVAVKSSTAGAVLYLDGKEDNKMSSRTGDVELIAGQNLNIGRDPIGRNINGLIDEVRIYATDLTAAKIQSQYYAGLKRLLTEGLMTKQEYGQRLLVNK
jgi:hypothetical protein